MKICHGCNKHIDDSAIFCPNCGARQDGTVFGNGTFSGGEFYQAPYREERTFLYSVLGFFIPIVGFILWIIWRESRPKASSAALKGAIIGAVVNLVVSVFYSWLLYSIGGLPDPEGLEGAALAFLRLL